MTPRSLLITLTSPPRIKVQDALFQDDGASEIEGVPVVAAVPPWNPMHDLLIDREKRELAGIVYPVATHEQAAIADICRSLPRQIVRYCLSPVSAAAVLRNPSFQLTEHIEIEGDPKIRLTEFPRVLRPYRQALRACFAGELDREQLPPEVLSVAGKYFQDSAAAEYLNDWASGGANVDRVEVVWVNKPVDPNLPSYFPSDLSIELAQYFAEDIWFYRDDQVYAIGINYLDQTLNDHGLRLPHMFPS